VQESTKELLHGENGGIRLRSFAERARKTYAVPNTRSGRSLPRRTKPRHFHECGTTISPVRVAATDTSGWYFWCVSGKSRSGAAARGIVPYELVLMPLLFWRGTDIRMKKLPEYLVYW